MPLEGKGKIHGHARGRTMIYVPASLCKNSAFPFKRGEDVLVRIEGRRLLIEKWTADQRGEPSGGFSR